MSDKMILEDIKKHDLSNTAIFSGAGVDPDGLASAEVMRQIIERHGGKATVFHKGTFNRPQNKTMRQVLNLALKPVEAFGEPSEWSCVISVDGPAEVCPVTPDFIIDHHQQGEPAKVASDVRHIGSCSAIMWKYAVEEGIDFVTEEGARLATAIAIGIMTDTDSGAVDSASDLDYEALSFSLKHKDNKLFREILNYPQPRYYNDLYAIGWENRTEEQAVLVTGLGDLTTGRSGAVSDLAEKFQRTDGVSTTVTFAMVDGNIMASARSSNSSLNVDEFVKTIFGAGGGKKGAGAAFIELPPLFKDLPAEVRDQLAKAIGQAITHKALQIAGDGVREKVVVVNE
jgi:nanoRNase/pAp phosphatase (c-di-AMP/oligoRNAs hydrolase)